MTAPLVDHAELLAGQAAAPHGNRVPIRKIALSCLGMLLVQVAWVLAVPAFGGMDEFDHVYRAAAVAHGEWVAPPSDATRGTGAWVLVPRDIARAAHDECAGLPYTTPADCVGVREGDFVRVASGAGRYNPLFYAMVGYPALPFHGHTAVYAMRAVGIAMCTGLLALSLVSLRRWSNTTWPLVGAIVACTPVVAYSSAIVAPNGLEIMAGLALWCSLVGILKYPRRSPDRFLVVVAGLSGSLLLILRSLGPLWCAMIVVTAVLAVPHGLRAVRLLMRSRAFLIGLTVLTLAGGVSVFWTEKMASLVVGVDVERSLTSSDKLTTILQLLPLWLFQSIAAFPYRNQQSVPVVYVCLIFVGFSLIVAGLRVAGHTRRAIVLCLAMTILVPAIISYATIEQYYGAWQGRYVLPYAVGILVLAGIALDHGSHSPGWRLLGPAVGLSVIAVATALLKVLQIERDGSPSVASGAWSPPSAYLVGLLASIGATLIWAAVSPPRGGRDT